MRHAQKRRHGLLQVGGKTGVYLGLYIHRPLLALGTYADGVVIFRDAHAHLQKLSLIHIFSTVGMMDSVRVSLTMVAKSPAASLKA